MADLQGTSESLDLLLELLDVLLLLLLLALQAPLEPLAPLELLVQPVHFLLQAALLASGRLGRLLRGLEVVVELLHARLHRGVMRGYEKNKRRVKLRQLDVFSGS